jgi:lysylphosphatidylglycerol synthetase-like protein (DUF2156 family)
VDCLVKRLVSLSAWIIVGAISGALLGIEYSLGCSPRGEWKPFFALMWAPLWSTEFAVMALLVGAVLVFAFRAGFLRHLVIASLLALAVLIVVGVAMRFFTPDFACAAL